MASFLLVVVFQSLLSDLVSFVVAICNLVHDVQIAVSQASNTFYKKRFPDDFSS